MTDFDKKCDISFKKKRYIALFCIKKHPFAICRLHKNLHIMATTKFYLDTRRFIPGKPCQIRLGLCFRGKTSLFSTGIAVLPEQWDKTTCTIVRHPQKLYLNARLAKLKSDWDIAIMQLVESGEAKKAKSPSELKEMILIHIDPETYQQKSGKFLSRFTDFAESRNAEGSKVKYRYTIKKMLEFDPELNERSFEDINIHWLKRFDKFMEKTSPSLNARAIHLRNIRAVFNDALDDEIISCYPFRKFKIRTQATIKRSLSVDELRTLMTYPCEEYQIIYRDMFMLMFYLCGINAVDLLNARPDAIVNGRLEYIRAKTHKPYSIKIEPEAMVLIEKYRGKDHLLNIMDERANYADFLRRMDKALKQIGEMERVGRGGKKVRQPLFPKLSQYWCRHTWATIAAELDIPKETIAAGLGHGGRSVTDIYIRFDRKKVDEANRKIIDFIWTSFS